MTRVWSVLISTLCKHSNDCDSMTTPECCTLLAGSFRRYFFLKMKVVAVQLHVWDLGSQSHLDSLKSAIHSHTLCISVEHNCFKRFLFNKSRDNFCICQWCQILCLVLSICITDICIGLDSFVYLSRAPVLVALALIELGMKYEDAVELIRE